MAQCEALIIGGSAGSLNVILTVLAGLSRVLTFPIVIVLHRKPGKDSILTQLLASRTMLKVKEIEEKERMEQATVYIAPPNYHLLIENDHTFSFDASEKVNFSRPAIDVTFQSAAEVFGENLVCLLLSGANNDGTEGLKTVKEKGGCVLIQDPSTAVVGFMPQNAALHVQADKILAASEMAAYINQLNSSVYHGKQ